MNQNERINWATGLLVKINAITGWVIPDGLLMDVLVDQFVKKLTESYPTVNPDEVEYAFRSYGTVIKDWGKQMNLALIDEVMIPYAEKRFEVSCKEEQIKNKLMLAESKDDISDQELWNQTEIMVNKGRYSAHLIPPGLYEWADENGNITLTKDQKMEYKIRSELVRHGEVVQKYEKDPYNIANKEELKEFNRMREAKAYSPEETGKIKDLAKKMVVFDMMKKR